MLNTCYVANWIQFMILILKILEHNFGLFQVILFVINYNLYYTNSLILKLKLNIKSSQLTNWFIINI